MLIAVPAETQAFEKRVAATPETVKKLVAAGCKVIVEKGAGSLASVPDADYEAAGAALADGFAATCAAADLVLKVQAPDATELASLKQGAVVAAMFRPHSNALLQAYADKGLTCFSMEMIPRITRAQSMDVLSSQANIAGYKAVLLATEHYQRFFPVMMTAAGTVQAAKVLVMGAGVAGLQAIATARRLGAMVEAFDVRPAAREQVQSLGAKFVEVQSDESGEGSGGYAKEMSEDYKRRQGELVAQHAAKSDVIVTTALIPGRPAPTLISEEMVKAMKPGSVIVDLAVEAGGNCPLSEKDKVVVKHGVILVGVSNIPSLMATDASALYARNMFNFVSLMLSKDSPDLKIDREDEIIEKSLLCIGGEFIKPEFLGGGKA